MQNGYPHLISVIKMLFKPTSETTEFLKTSEADAVSVDRNSSWGGE